MPVPHSQLRIALSLATALLAVGTNGARSQGLSSPPIDGTILENALVGDWHASNHFEVRAGRKDRLVVQAVCEPEGEIALVELAMTAPIEEAFLFVPSECLWIEIGQDETAYSVSTDLREIQKLARVFQEIVLYHVHPGRPIDAREYFPAYSDLLNALILSPGIGYGDESEIRHRAVTAQGVIDYGFFRTDATESLIQMMRDTGLSGSIAENLILLYATELRETHYYDAIVACNAGISGAPERIGECFPMDVNEFRLDYRQVTAGDSSSPPDADREP